MTQLIDRATIDFLLFDLFQAEALCDTGLYDHHDRTSLNAALDLAQSLSQDHLWPHAALSDIQEPELVDGEVRILPDAKAALGHLREAGFFAAHAGLDHGGMQLPVVINHACNGMMKGANPATHAYMSLTRAAGNLLSVHGSEMQKRLFLGPMLEGRFFGTMCLSEPDAGSSLSDLRTRAHPRVDGAYEITGTKMWISGGDHDAAENIVHLVLARLPGQPPGVRGISLFAVPKYHVNEDGKVGGRNGVTVAGLNHKMGYRGTSNCLLNFGDDAPAIGTLVGHQNEGLAAMFHMMNEARISVGIGGAMLASVAYRYALGYAQERRQGRRLDTRDPNTPQVHLVDHPDVRRMLLRQKALSEGGLALCLYAGTLVDRRRLSTDPQDAERLDRLLDLLTPVVKAWPSEFGLEANRDAIQVLGGYGYTRDFPVERLYRDNRLNMIHEGTNGIQALDLLGRKVLGSGRGNLDILFAEVDHTVAGITSDNMLAPMRKRLDAFEKQIAQAATVIDANIDTAGKVRALGNATPFLNAFGHFVVAWLWLRSANASQRADVDAAFADGKRTACKYFFDYELPQAQAWLQTACTDASFLDTVTPASL